jgi:hypothetical protein
MLTYIYKYAKMYRLGMAMKREVAVNTLTAIVFTGNFRGACPLHTAVKCSDVKRLQHKR